MATQTKKDNRVEWFLMLISYVKFETLKFWLQCNQHGNQQHLYEIFEAIWPLLLDNKLNEATREAIKKLGEDIKPSSN